ncbi:MAG: glycine--tRNA ligase [Verrucomicrobiota bacterium]
MAEPKVNELMEKIVSLCKRRGFVFQSSEIYGGLNGFWDYGPLGAELKRNVKEQWWRSMTQRDNVAGLEASIIMHPRIWEASGHTSTFTDLMVDCLLTKKRFRADQVEPLSGTVYHYDGAMDPVSRKNFNEPYSALVLPGKSEDSARKLACRYYQERGINGPQLLGERTEKVQNTTRYNPENGSLLTEARPFNLMFKTYVGPVEAAENVAYLRPETAQAIFAQFKNVLEVSRQKVPFGICQIGKAFRNEINPRNFTFRSREFEQMELEFFIPPDEAVQVMAEAVAPATASGHPGEPQANWGWELWHKYWVEERLRFYENIGLPRTSLEEYWQKPDELAHYAKATVDILYKFPFGTQELEGIAARGDFDLSQHQQFSGKSMEYFDDALRTAWTKLDPERKAALQQRYASARREALLKKGQAEADAGVEAETEARKFFERMATGNYVPHVIEPSAGVDRLILALICNAYCEDQAPDEKGKMETRVVMRFHPRIAPIKVAIFPLLKNRPELVQKARQVHELLRPYFSVWYDDAGAIGRRYRRQDEAGTPFGVTIDFDTLGEKGPELKDTVTLRDRDTMQQVRIKIDELLPVLLEKVR